MGSKEIIAELEEPPLIGCELTDVDRLLKSCGYECYLDSEQDTLIYVREGWQLWTFTQSMRWVPQGLLGKILEVTKWHLGQEGGDDEDQDQR